MLRIRRLRARRPSWARVMGLILMSVGPWIGGSSGSGLSEVQMASTNDSWVSQCESPWVFQEREVLVEYVDVVDSGLGRWGTLSALFASSVLTLFFVSLMMPNLWNDGW